MKTYSTKAGDVKREWHLFDASGKTLGRLASQVANLLMGKHKPIYVPYLDTGDYVVVVNAAKVSVTGSLRWARPPSPCPAEGERIKRLWLFHSP